MKKLLLFTLTLLLLPAAAQAQEWNWEFESVFPDTAAIDDAFSSVHGIAVDPDGKVWLQPFSATEEVERLDAAGEVKDTVATRALHVYNADGTEAEISPVLFVEFPGGEVDTLGGYTITEGEDAGNWEGRSGRGITTDANGNIVVSAWNTLYRIDYQTGAGINKVFPDIGSLTEPTVDENNVTYIAPVVAGGASILMYDEEFNFLGNAVDNLTGFSRDFQVSPDGLKIFWGDYTSNAVVLFERADEFSAFDSVGVVIPGVDSESFGIHPTNGWLYVSAGSPNDVPNDYPDVTTNWKSNTWYAFDMADLTVPEEGINMPMPMDSLTWGECETFTAGVCNESQGRPRGIDFSPDGEIAYIAQFSQAAPSSQKLVNTGSVAIERDPAAIPEHFALHQNYPNPFNPSTQIGFELERAATATLKVYDVLGKEVATLVDDRLGAGSYTATFDASELASGTYLYVLSVDGQRLTRTMLLVK